MRKRFLLGNGFIFSMVFVATSMSAQGSHSLISPTHVSSDARAGGSNLVISGFGDNRLHVLCRSSANGICAQIANTETPDADGMTVLAGNGWPVNSGDGASADSAGIFQPSASAVDSHGNVVVATHASHAIRVICLNTDGICGGATDGVRLYAPGQAGGTKGVVPGHIYHLAGVWSETSTNPNFGFGSGAGCRDAGDGVPANESCLNEPYGVAIDSHDNVLIADTNNGRVRVVCLNQLSEDPYCGHVESGRVVQGGEPARAGHIYTLAGDGDGTQLSLPISLAVDRYDNVALADGGHFRVRMVCAGAAGLCRSRLRSARSVYTAAAHLGSIAGVGFDSGNNLLISDPGNATISLVCGGGKSALCNGQQPSHRIRLSAGEYRSPMHAFGLPEIGDPFVITDRDSSSVHIRFY